MSVDGCYGLDRNWTIGGKFGYRPTESTAGCAAAFVSNDAWLAAANARYHLGHDWDVRLNNRSLQAFGEKRKIGVGCNMGLCSFDQTELTHVDKGAFINLIAKFQALYVCIKKGRDHR